METKSRRTFLVAAGAALSLSSTALAKPLKGDERTSGVWRAGTPLPFAVQEIYPALHNGQIHLAGGFVSDGASISGASDRHIAMAPETGTWFEVSRLPTPRHHPNLISFNGQLLSIGGFETEGPEAVWVMQAGVWSFDGVRCAPFRSRMVKASARCLQTAFMFAAVVNPKLMRTRIGRTTRMSQTISSSMMLTGLGAPQRLYPRLATAPRARKFMVRGMLLADALLRTAIQIGMTFMTRKRIAGARQRLFHKLKAVWPRRLSGACSTPSAESISTMVAAFTRRLTPITPAKMDGIGCPTCQIQDMGLVPLQSKTQSILWEAP